MSTTSADATLPIDDLPLRGVRVLECGGHLGAAYLGRLLADLGADVVKLEPPDGDPLRHRGPYAAGRREPAYSAAAAALHAGKRSVVIGAADASRELLGGLLGRADVLVRDRSPHAPAITEAVLAAAELANPELIVADLTSYGLSGPLAHRDDPDIVVAARSGMLSITSTIGSASTETGPSRPLRYAGEATWIYTACHGGVAVLGALHARRRHGLGQRLDVSGLESLVAVLATSVPQYTYAGKVVTHETPKIVRPWAIYRLVDGEISVQCTEDSQWHALVGLLGSPAWGANPDWETTLGRVAAADEVERLVAAGLAKEHTAEFLHRAHAAGVPATEVQSNAEVLAWEQLAARRFFTTMQLGATPDTVGLRVPGPPLRFDGMLPPRHTTAPALGAHSAEVLREWRTGPRDPTPTAAVAVTGTVDPSISPLGDVRIVDMTWVWAGPFATMQLAYLGAEVIKIESPTRIDVVRRLGPYAAGIVGINRSGYFNQYNQGKQSIALDLTTAADRAVLDGLIARSDLIVDNMRNGALVRMGYDDVRLHTINPQLVATALSGFGDTGPDKDRAAYGAIINSLSGVAEITGRVGGGPVDLQLSLADPCSGLHAAIGMLAALYRQRLTGRGGRADCAMVEAWIAACPWGVLAEACGTKPVAVGNRDAVLCPNGVFPCAGDDEWVALAIDGDEQFAVLARVLERPELAADPRFATVEARRANEDALEEAVAAWTAQRTPQEAAARLEQVGVAAARVDRMDDVLASAQLADREFFTALDHPEVGPLRLAGPAFRASRSPIGPTRPAPRLGEHTAEVLHRILGIDRST